MRAADTSSRCECFASPRDDSGTVLHLTRWHLREQLRALPGGNVLVHVLVFLLGSAFVALGLALVVLPGPLTIPPVLLGLFVWSLEFVFAERLLARAKSSADSAWRSARRRPWQTAIISGGGLLLAVTVAVLVSRHGLDGLADRVRAALG